MGLLTRGSGFLCVLLLGSGCALPIVGAPQTPRMPRGPSPAPRLSSQPDAPTPTPAPRQDRAAQPPRPQAVALSTAVPTRPAAQGTASATPSMPAPPRSAKACYDRLWRSGSTFELVDRGDARGVAWPIRVTNAIGGIRVRSKAASGVHEIIDCRLALQLLAWAPSLRAAGVVGLIHYSVYRPGARTPRGRRSGHASGLAIDVAAYEMSDGSAVDVLTDWEERDRDGAPCPRRPNESWGSRVLRGTVCDAVEHDLFSVVLTPHHDEAHQNHVHLELKLGTDWTYVK